MDSSPLFNQLLSIGMITSWLPGGKTGMIGTLTMLVMGYLLEMGRDAYTWVSDRWRFQYSLTAEFHEGDPTFDWIMTFLTREQVWKRSWNFKISAKTSQKKNSVQPSETPKVHNSENADYVPTYGRPQVFRWNGYWIEVTRNITGSSYDHRTEQNVDLSTIYLTVYTRDVSVVSSLVEHSRKIYMEVSQPHVTIHTSTRTYQPYWNECKRKLRRSLDSVLLQAGVLESLVADVREFLDMEDWYQTAGIPYRRGFLLYGPPGTGKTSTIYALAGEIGLEIYSLSLASASVDDSMLASAVGSIPKGSIFLLEDIDRAFSRNEDLPSGDDFSNMQYSPPRSSVTLSGLLNVLDGVASQEGILFFATTNHIEDLDSALIRPGRIDRKIQYYHCTKHQTIALFKRFFPPSHCTPESAKEGILDKDKAFLLDSLAEQFATQIPEGTFTTAELQGFLLTCKFKPEKAVKEVKGWADETVKDKLELEEKKKAKQENAQKKRDGREMEKLQSTLRKLGTAMELERTKEGELDTGASKINDVTSRDPVEEVPSVTSGTQSPASMQGSDSDSWTVTEAASTTVSKNS